MRGRLEEVRAAGAELVFVGSGSPAHARAFARNHPGVVVLTDPALESHRRLGLKRGVGATLGPRSLAAGIRSTLRGHLQTSVKGDVWQQGGLFAVRQGGELAFEQRYADAGDRPDLDGALAALREDPDRPAAGPATPAAQPPQPLPPDLPRSRPGPRGGARRPAG